jgi:hypothetical protein
MRVGLKSFVISWTTGLYRLKFAKSSALTGDFQFRIIGRFCYSLRSLTVVLLMQGMIQRGLKQPGILVTYVLDTVLCVHSLDCACGNYVELCINRAELQSFVWRLFLMHPRTRASQVLLAPRVFWCSRPQDTP